MKKWSKEIDNRKRYKKKNKKITTVKIHNFEKPFDYKLKEFPS